MDDRFNGLTLGHLARNLQGLRLRVTLDDNRVDDADVDTLLESLAQLALRGNNLRVFQNGTIAEFIPAPYSGVSDGGVVRITSPIRGEIEAVYAATDGAARQILGVLEAEHGGRK